MSEILTEQPATPQPEPEQPQLYVGLDGIEVQFPEGFWDQPSLDLLVRGRPYRETVIDHLALTIAGGLRKALAAKRASPSGLVGPDGRPISR